MKGKKKKISNQKNKTTSFKDFLGGKKRSYRGGSIHFFWAPQHAAVVDTRTRKSLGSTGTKKERLKG